jgi:iron complex outermembrane recepter protein
MAGGDSTRTSNHRSGSRPRSADEGSSLPAWRGNSCSSTPPCTTNWFPFELADDPGKRYFRNTARSTREGWEFALQFSPSRYLSTRLVASTNEARFESYAPEGEDLSGNRVPGIAPHKLEGIMRVGPGRWFGEVRGEILGPIEGNDRNDPEARSPSRQLVDLRAGINELRLLGFDLSPFVGLTNVFDEEYNTSVVVNATGGRYFEPGPGRAMYMGASLGWQR